VIDMNTIRNLKNLRGDRRGVTALEYGLIAALIAVVVIGSISAIGASMATEFTTVSSAVQGQQ
jgi:pilus assembly protein Flp/PilA